MNRASWLRRLGRAGSLLVLVSVALLGTFGSLAEGLESREVSESSNPLEQLDPLDPLELGDAVTLALANGLAARIARLEAGQAGDMADKTRALYLPHLLVDSQVGWSNRMNETFVAGDDKRYGLDNLGNEPWVDIYLDQVLLDMGLLRRMERDRLAEDLAAIAEEEVREAVAYEVIRQYADLVRLESLAAAAAEQLVQAAWLEREARHLGESGRVLAVDREGAEIHFEASEQRVEALRFEIASARALLRVSLGASRAAAEWPKVVPASLRRPTGAGVLSVLSVLSNEAIDEALLSGPELRMLELQIRMEEASVGAAKAERLPTLQLRGGWSHYGIKRFDHFEDEAYVFVGIHLPVFDGMQATSAVRGARKARDVARLKYRSALGAKRGRAERKNHRLAALDRELALAERRADMSLARQRLVDLDLKAQRGPVAAALGARERSVQHVEASIQLRYRRLELWASLQRELGQLVASIQTPSQPQPSSAP